MLSFLLGIIPLTTTISGIFLYLKQNHGIKSCFLPIVTVCSITIILFFFGLLNALQLAVMFLFFGGTGYLVRTCCKMRKEGDGIPKSYEIISEISKPYFLFFLLISLYFITLLWGFTLYAYDDFTHWGAAWKEIMTFHSLPDSRTVVTYQNYPPATAIWCYFVCYFLGAEENVALIAQSFVITASLTTLFCNTEKKDFLKIVGLSFASILCFLCLLSEQRFSLNVDALLAYVFVALFVVIYDSRENFPLALKMATPLSLFLLLTKDSGKFFVAMALVALLPVAKSALDKKKENKTKSDKNNVVFQLFLYIGSLFAMDCLWGRYVEKAYPVPSYEANKFEASGITSGIEGKSEEFLSTLPTLFYNSFFDFRYFHTKLFFGIFITSFVCLFLFTVLKAKVKNLLVSTLFFFVMTGIYLMGLYVMYATVMPANEHPENYLVAFERYFPTMILVVFLCQVFMILEHVPLSGKNEKVYPCTVSGVVAVSLILLPYLGHNIFAFPTHPTFEYRLRTESLITLFDEAEKVVPRQKKVLISMVEYNVSTSIYYHISRYELGSDISSSWIDNGVLSGTKEELIEHLGKYEYILIYDNMETVRSSLKALDIPFYYEEDVSVYSIVLDESTVFLYPCAPEE